MDNASLAATCKLLPHQEQLLQVQHPQDLYDTTSVMFTVKRLMTTTITMCWRSTTTNKLTNGTNPDYARELPAHYLKHWGLLVDTGAYVSVAPEHFAPEVLLEPVPHPVQLLTQQQLHPSRSTGQRQYY